jgi:hypothetical protein
MVKFAARTKAPVEKTKMEIERLIKTLRGEGLCRRLAGRPRADRVPRSRPPYPLHRPGSRAAAGGAAEVAGSLAPGEGQAGGVRVRLGITGAAQ